MTCSGVQVSFNLYFVFRFINFIFYLKEKRPIIDSDSELMFKQQRLLQDKLDQRTKEIMVIWRNKTSSRRDDGVSEYVIKQRGTYRRIVQVFSASFIMVF